MKPRRDRTMDKKVRDTAEKLFNSEYEKLTEQERHVAHHITERTRSDYGKEERRGRRA